MRIFEDLRSGLTPAVEELHQSWDEGRSAPLRGRELLAEAATAAAFIAVAVAFAVLLPADRAFDAPLAATLLATYTLLARVHFPIGYGFTIPTQLVLVPMLFLVPLGAVPLLVAAGMLLGGLPEYLDGERHPTRAIAAVGDSWHAVGPVAVLAAIGIAAPELADWPVLLAALAAQVAVDNGVAAVRDRAGLGIPLKLQPSLFGWVTLVDLLLSPVGLIAAMAAVAEPYAALLVLPLAALLLVFALERGARVRQAIELSRAYRGTTLLLSDVLEEDDEYTGFHSRSVVSLSVAVADAMGLSSKQRRNVEFGALLHEVGKIVRSSHERWDGSGYPDGLSGDEIPVESSIVSCCDAFNAMTTERSYRAAMSLDEALAELRANSGSQFAPRVVEALDRVISEDPLAAGARGPRVAVAA